MRIAIIADPFIPVPPVEYGGIERIIDFLVKGLIEQGHELVLLAHKESKVDCELWPYSDHGNDFNSLLRNALLVSKLTRWRPDIIHSFGRLAYLAFLLPKSIPKIMSYQREPTPRTIKIARQTARRKTLHFTGCSNYITNKISIYAPASTIYNGVPENIYIPNYSVPDDAPLVFLGRLEAIKGPHIAIQVAKATNSKLIIAGNLPKGAISENYFTKHIQPHLDGKEIQYIGPVNDLKKNDLLRSAKALLMPILWHEPFGIVVAEAMACGTPVVAFGRGAIPEIITNSVNGFVCDSIPDMITAVLKVRSEIDRKTVRQTVEHRFSAKKIVSDYLNLYELQSANHI